MPGQPDLPLRLNLCRAPRHDLFAPFGKENVGSEYHSDAVDSERSEFLRASVARLEPAAFTQRTPPGAPPRQRVPMRRVPHVPATISGGAPTVCDGPGRHHDCQVRVRCMTLDLSEAAPAPPWAPTYRLDEYGLSTLTIVDNVELDLGARRPAVQAALVDVDEVSRAMTTMTTGSCTIWVERGPIDVPRAVFVAVKIASACIHIPTGVAVRVLANPKGRQVVARVESRQRRAFLYRTLHRFLPKLRTLVKAVVQTPFFVDAPASDDRAIRAALLAHPIVLTPGDLRTALFRAFTTDTAFAKRVSVLTGTRVTFTVDVDLARHVIDAPVPVPGRLVRTRLVAPRWSVPRAVPLDVVWSWARATPSAPGACAPTPSLDVAFVDSAVDGFNHCRSSRQRAELFGAIWKVWVRAPPRVWFERGAAPVLLRALAGVARPTSDAVFGKVVDALVAMADDDAGASRAIVTMALRQFEDAPASLALITFLWALVCRSPTAARATVEQHGIQRLLRQLARMAAPRPAEDPDRHDAPSNLIPRLNLPSIRSSPAASPHPESSDDAPAGVEPLNDDGLFFQMGQDLVLNELGPLLRHLRDYRQAEQQRTPSLRPLRTTITTSSMASRRPSATAAAAAAVATSPPVLTMTLLGHLLIGLPEQVPCPIPARTLLHVADHVVTPDSASHHAFVALVTACESRSSAAFFDALAHEYVTATHPSSKLLRLGVAYVESRAGAVPYHTLLPLTMALFDKASAGCVGRVASSEALALIAPLLRLWATVIRDSDRPSIDAALYTDLIKNGKRLDVVAGLAPTASDDACADLVDAVLALLRALPALSRRMRAMARRVANIYAATRALYAYPNGLLYRWMRALTDSARDLPLLTKIVGTLTAAHALMEPAAGSSSHPAQVTFHVLRFVRLYCRDGDGDGDQSSALRVCSLHVDLLRSLAETRSLTALARLHDLQVAVFLAYEFCLEFEARLQPHITLRYIHRRRLSSLAMSCCAVSNFTEASPPSPKPEPESPRVAAISLPTGTRMALDLADAPAPPPNLVPEPSSRADDDNDDEPRATITVVPRLHLKRNSVQTATSTNTEYIEQRVRQEAEAKRLARSSKRSSRSFKDDKDGGGGCNNNAESAVHASYDDDDDATDSDDASSASDEAVDDDGTIIGKVFRRISNPLMSLGRSSLGRSSAESTALANLVRGLGSDPASKFSGKALSSSKTAASLKSKSLNSKSSAARVRTGSIASSTGPVHIQERYFQQRLRRRLYADRALHLAMLRLLLRLMVDRNGMALSPRLCHRTPTSHLPHQLNLPFIVHQHVNNPANRKALADLERLEVASSESAHRLVRLLSLASAHTALLEHRVRIAKGRFGEVLSSRVEGRQEPCAVKVVDVPATYHDYQVVPDLFSEITILERFRHRPNVTHVLDYAVTDDGYQVVMDLYAMSLRQWRLSLYRGEAPTPTKGMGLGKTFELLDACLDIYHRVLVAVQDLHDNHCIHFDLKCDNVLIRGKRAGGGVPVAALANMMDECDVCLADFGESLMWNPSLGESGQSLVGRGTENIQSPEILSLSDPNSPDQRRRASSTPRSAAMERQVVSTGADIWAIGCLLFELLTGEFMFEDRQGMPIFFQVISRSQPIISHKNKFTLASMFGEGVGETIADFLGSVLVRSVARRPPIQKVIAMYHALRSRLHHVKAETLQNEKQAAAIRLPLFFRRGRVAPAGAAAAAAAWKYRRRSVSVSSSARSTRSPNRDPLDDIITAAAAASQRLPPGATPPAAVVVAPFAQQGADTAPPCWAAFDALADTHPERALLPSAVRSSMHRVTSMCSVVVDADVPARAVPIVQRLGFSRVVHCGAGPTATMPAATATVAAGCLVLLSGKYAGRLGAIGRFAGDAADVRLVVDLAAWIRASVHPCAIAMQRCIADGDRVVIVGRDRNGPVVMVLVFLMVTYRISLLEAVLTLKQRGIIGAVEETIVRAVQCWAKQTIGAIFHGNRRGPVTA